MNDDRLQIISLSHHQSLLEAMHQLRIMGHLCDITVQVDYQGEIKDFEAHRVVIAASSGYFKSIFLADEPVKKAQLFDVPTSAFDAFLQYVYTGQVEVARSMVDNISKMAELLDCVDLVDACKAVSDLVVVNDTETVAPDGLAESDASHEVPPPKRRGRRPTQSKPAVSKDPQASKELEKTTEKKGKAPGRRLSNRLASRKEPVGLPKAKRARRGRTKASEGSSEKPKDGEEGTEIAAAVLGMEQNDDGTFASQSSGSDSESSSSSSDHDLRDDPQDTDFRPDKDGEGEVGEEAAKEGRVPRVAFQCEKCDRPFLYEKSFLKHVRQNHGEQPEVTYRCGTCQQTFANRCNLKIHERHVHSEERLFPCDVCTKAFKRKKDVKRHRRQVHEGGGERHHCPVCGKALSSRTALTLHERTHTGQRPYGCLECGAKFSQSSALKTHRRWAGYTDTHNTTYLHPFHPII